MKRVETNARYVMKHGYNEMKLRVLASFEGRGWLSVPAWAVLASYYPLRAAYTYMKRLWRWELVDRQLDRLGFFCIAYPNAGRRGLHG